LKSQALINNDDKKSSRHFGTSRFGYIDYTPYSGIIRTLVEAMDWKRTCRLTYKAIMENRSKTYYVNPLKIFSHRDTIYLHAKLASSRNELGTDADFDPLLAIHRIKKVEMTDRSFRLPAKYDFEKIFNRNFGIMKGEPFKAAVEFKGWAAKYVSERIWSPDQKIKKIGKDKIILEFTASSESEVISWLLWFGEEARLTKPERLTEEIIHTIDGMKSNYL
jgi:predicted DNA-binding transcriptional regulator YafY